METLYSSRLWQTCVLVSKSCTTCCVWELHFTVPMTSKEQMKYFISSLCKETMTKCEYEQCFVFSRFGLPSSETYTGVFNWQDELQLP
ncbi:hypothetical protein AGIG_G21109 [Arapaima gigas]